MDMNPTGGTDVKTTDNGDNFDDNGVIRVLTPSGAYVKTLQLAGGDSEINDIAFNADKSNYYIVGYFNDTTNFDINGGTNNRTAGDGYDTPFLARYQTSNDELLSIQVLD